MNAIDPLRRLHASRRLTAGKLGDVQKAKRRHVRQFQRAGAQTCAIRSTGGAELGDVAQRVGAEIAILLGIRRATHAEGIQNEEKSPCHTSPKKARRKGRDNKRVI